MSSLLLPLQWGAGDWTCCTLSTCVLYHEATLRVHKKHLLKILLIITFYIKYIWVCTGMHAPQHTYEHPRTISGLLLPQRVLGIEDRSWELHDKHFDPLDHPANPQEAISKSMHNICCVYPSTDSLASLVTLWHFFLWLTFFIWAFLRSLS